MNNGAAAPARIVLPDLYAKQEQALYPAARFSLIEGSTKSGKTAGCMIWQLSQILLGPPGTIHWWVAPVYGQARIAFRRAIKDFDALIQSASHSELRITLTNGSVWFFKSGENPDNLFGEEIESAVIDEASRMREEAWTAVRSTLSTTRGPARLIGNVKGRGNWFYKLCRRAEAGEPNYHYAKLTAQDAVEGGVLHEDELEQASRDLPHEVYRELYFCEPADDAYNPFGLDYLQAAFGGVAEMPAVVYGLDLARKHDHTVLVGMSQLGHVVSVDRFQLPWSEAYERIKRVVGNRPVLMDATGIGDPISDELRRQRVNVTPFVITSRSKQDLMMLLRSGFSEGKIRFEHEIMRLELESFEYEYTLSGGVRYSAPSGMHDDCVDALGLAYWHAVHLGALRPVSAGVALSASSVYAGVRRDRARAR